MSTPSDLKRIIRKRQRETGESHTAAREHVIAERAALLGEPDEEPTAEKPSRLDAAVLKVNRQSARVRVLGEAGEITFRSRDIWQVVPGHLVTLSIEKRWSFKGDDYASGRIENPRIAIEKLALTPLPVREEGLIDLRSDYEPFEKGDPYFTLWRQLTERPRRSLVMHPIAWGQFPGAGEHYPTCDAADLAQVGRSEEAYELLMEVLGTDLRCLDAHAYLGNLEFDHAPDRAMLHYEIGVRIGELSLATGFDGVVLFGHLYNRPFLRCLHGYGLCLWRLGQLREAEQVFERMLSLNPTDNQGVRICLNDVRKGRRWEEAQAEETLGYG
ncbi:MAG TPA: tetratricopeptide repeat protein [Steroidobacteraceae bacterium]|nr:tetratricopeptide repeat protein [Steroidobacteraceae bacterium]